MEQMKIGVSSFDRGNFVKAEYFKIEAGKDNVYRILPPLFSYAESGKWNQYYSTHTIWLNKKPFHFQCILKKNKEKHIVQECPFCTEAELAEASLKSFRESMTKEQVRAYEQAKVSPFQANKKVYMNAVNQSNVPGLLPIGFKLFETLNALLSNFYNKNFVDATGQNGLFLNFKKNQAYPGDRNTSYSVEFYQAVTQNPDGSFTGRYVNHTITDELLNKLSAGGAKDLATLYPTVSYGEISSLARAVKAGNDENTKTLCETVFSRSTKVTPTVSSTIGGTDVVAVSPIVMQNADIVLKPAFVSPSEPTPPWTTAITDPTPVTASVPVASSSDDLMSDAFFKKLMEG